MIKQYSTYMVLSWKKIEKNIVKVAKNKPQILQLPEIMIFEMAT